MHETQGMIEEAYASGSEIESLVSDIENVIEGKPNSFIIMACLATAILAQAPPNITPEQMAQGIKGASQWLALYLSTLDDDTNLQPNKVN